MAKQYSDTEILSMVSGLNKVVNDALIVQDSPYLVSITVQSAYNPNYGDKRLCRCGDPYERHFDTYDEMRPIGCKYCYCFEFVEGN